MPTTTFKEQEEETRLFWQAIANKTRCLVKLNFAIYQKGNRISQWIFLNNNRPIEPLDVIRVLKKEHAWLKNKEYKKSVLWKFAEEQTYNVVGEQLYNIALLDDIRDIQRFIDKDYFLLWETSKGKYQAAFLLDRYVFAEHIKKIQRALIEIYGGDKASLGACHNVRMPGFYNTKYLDNPPYVKLIYMGDSKLPVEQLLRFYKDNIESKKEKPKETKNLSKLLAYKELKEKKKSWWDFYKGDKSVADFAYAKYLMNFNLTNEDIKQILLSESDDIENRKKGHLEDYLERTVSKARLHFKPSEGEN